MPPGVVMLLWFSRFYPRFKSMNSPSNCPTGSVNNKAWIFLIAALLLLPFMPSTSSLWVDEAQTWTYASKGSLSNFVAELTSETKSEAQMPLGMLAFWAGGKLFGLSELGLRSINLLWAAGTLFVFYLLGKREGIPLLPLILVIQPFFWFYVNEARPYALQIFGGSLLLLSLHHALGRNGSDLRTMLLWGIGSLLVSGASMLGGIPVVVVTFLLAIAYILQRRLPSRGSLIWASGFLLLLLGLATYYFRTLLGGAGGSKIWQLGPQNLLFSAVELAGFSGLLPGRQVLRDLVRHGGWANLDATTLTIAALGSGLLTLYFLILGLWWVRHLRQTPAWVWYATCVSVASALILCLAAAVVGFPFWGRHLAPAFPFVIAIVGWLTFHCYQSTGPLIRTGLLLGLVALLVSAVALRFSPHHAKDDYRASAALAKESLKRGEIVWWAADPAAARCYGLQPSSPEGEEGLVLTKGASADRLDQMPAPALIVVSKPDIYDSSGALQKWLNERSYEKSQGFTAFTIWRRPAD